MSDRDGRRLRRGQAGERRPRRRCSSAPPRALPRPLPGVPPRCCHRPPLPRLARHRSLDIDDLRDLQDDVGIGGSCSDFLHYLYSSFSSAQVKLIFPAAQVKLIFPAAQAPATVKLVATKAKGLPLITISLHPVAASALKDVIADFSLALYASYKTTQEHLSIGKKNEVMQKQLEALSILDKRKASKPKLVTDQVPSVSGAPPVSDQVIVPVQQQTSVASPSKVPPAKSVKGVAPVSRRARVRGALLQDTEENDDS